MNLTQLPLILNLDYPLPEEFSTADELERFLATTENHEVSMVYATEFARLYFAASKTFDEISFESTKV